MEKWKLKSIVSSYMIAAALLISPIQAMEMEESIKKLPKETLSIVLTIQNSETQERYLTQRDIFNFSQVCIDFQKIATDSYLWTLLSRQDGFVLHKNTAFKAHYNFWKAKALINNYGVFNNKHLKELSKKKALEIIKCLNQGAPYMHLGCIDLLVDVMDSPRIPLGISCVQLPKDLNLNIFPLLTEKDILAKADDEFFEMCSQNIDNLPKFSPEILGRFKKNLISRDLLFIDSFVDSAINSYHDLKQKYPLSKDSENKHLLEMQKSHIDDFIKNKKQILSRLSVAKEKGELIVIDLFILFFQFMIEEEDLSYSSDSEECSFSQEKDVNSSDSQIKEEVQEILDDLISYINGTVLPEKREVLTNYIDYVGSELEDQVDMFDIIDNQDPHYSKVKEEGYSKTCSLFFPILGKGNFTPITILRMLDFLNLYHFDKQDKLPFYISNLCLQNWLKYPSLCFMDFITGIDNSLRSYGSYFENSNSKLRHDLTGLKLCNVQFNHKINVNLIHNVFSHYFYKSFENIESEIWLQFFKRNSFPEFLQNLIKVQRPKLLKLEKSPDINNDIDSEEALSDIYITLGVMYLYENNWEEAKSYYLKSHQKVPLSNYGVLNDLINWNKFVEAEELLDICDPDKTNKKYKNHRMYLEDRRNNY